MRTICATILAASLAFASSAWAEPLAPGKPAGVHQAARKSTRTGFLIAGGVLAGGIAALAAFGGSDDNKGVLTSGISTTGTAG